MADRVQTIEVNKNGEWLSIDRLQQHDRHFFQAAFVYPL